MAVLRLLADGIGTVNYALVTDYSGATFVDAVARTRFAANVDLASNLLTMATQLLVTRWLLPRKGPGFVIMVWALASVAALMVVVFSPDPHAPVLAGMPRSEEHTSELQSLMRISYAVFCLKKKKCMQIPAY